MRKVSKTQDVSGRDVQVGDTVTTLNGDVTGKICDICIDLEVAFVRVRPLHQSYGQGVWHAADRTMWLSAARQRPKAKPKPKAKTPPKRHARKG